MDDVGFKILLAVMGFAVLAVGLERWRGVRRGKAIVTKAHEGLEREQEKVAERRDETRDQIEKDLAELRKLPLGSRLYLALRRAALRRAAARKRARGNGSTD